MKLKLDLHPIYNDSREIDASLAKVIQEAIDKRITEVEVIPGKGSGALKKTVLRYLDRPEVRSLYHRIEKDGDNWGRLFIHFRWGRLQAEKAIPVEQEMAEYTCFCCGAVVKVPVDSEALLENGPEVRVVECPPCGSPNRLTLRHSRKTKVAVKVEPGYE
jgi:DNA-directed RNA polymerase subunit RPC12/RpoP